MSENSHNLVPKIDESMSVRNEFDEEAFPLNIRLGELRDVPVIQNVVRDAYEQYVAAEGSKPAPMTVDYSSLVEANHAWVAEQAGHVIGLLVLEAESDHLLLENIAVAPEVRGKGVGHQLLSFAEEQARLLRLPEIRLYTGEVMTQNLHYYPRHGYHETHRGYEDGHHRVYFSKTIEPKE